jgi:hypothetical protein
MHRRNLRTYSARVAVALTVALAGLPVAGPLAGGDNPKNTMVFAFEMAERGNWREARYRWELVEREQPNNPKVLNNLAVAYEVLGLLENARDYYNRAVFESGGDPGIEENRRRSAHFWRQVLELQDDGEKERAQAPPATTNTSRAGGKTKGKTVRVPVGLPVPARLDLEGFETLLVVSFLGQDTNLLETNRDLVRFLRTEFRQATPLDVLDINPPPAVPEQTVEDLLANKEFWQWLGRNYNADMIVSGVINYDREDISGFRDVDVVSPRTGQKVRENRFVEQEQFVYMFDYFFMDGRTGAVLFRDKLQRQVLYQGLQNDPIHAFYAMSESIAGDVMAVVSTRMRFDTRVVFKK